MPTTKRKKRSSSKPKRKISLKRSPAKKKKRAKSAVKRAPAKGGAKKRKLTTKQKRSAAAKKAWAKRKKRARLIEAMDALDFREVALPTRDELYDYLKWASEAFEIEISDMYRLYFGYGVGDVTPEVWEQ